MIQAIKEAREEGDLKENAGYDAARERQGFWKLVLIILNQNCQLLMLWI